MEVYCDTDNPSVLIVDDDPGIRGMVAICLRREHYRVYEAEDGLQALALVERELPDVLIVDLGIPGLNGPKLCGEIRARDLSMPIMALTAYDEVNLKVRVLDAGFDDYMTKPFIPEELLARVRALLRRSTARV